MSIEELEAVRRENGELRNRLFLLERIRDLARAVNDSRLDMPNIYVTVDVEAIEALADALGEDKGGV